MAGPAWIDGVERLGDGRVGGAMDGGEPRATAHTVQAPQGSGWFDSMAGYLIRANVEPQVLYDPKSDRLGQFCPLTQSGRALRNAGSVRTNRTGRVNVQIEFLGYAEDPFTDGWDPAGKPNFRKLCAAIRAHGVPDEWPAGRPQAYPGDHDDRDMWTWLNRAGWYGHSQVPGNSHGDPGAIDTSKVPWRGTDEEDDMTPEERQLLRETHEAVTSSRGVASLRYKGPDGKGPDVYALLTRAADPVNVLGYRPAKADAESVAKTGEHLPDVYGLINGTNYLVHKVREEADEPTPVQVDAAAVADALKADGGFVDVLATALADRLSKRLEK